MIIRVMVEDEVLSCSWKQTKQMSSYSCMKALRLCGRVYRGVGTRHRNWYGSHAQVHCLAAM